MTRIFISDCEGPISKNDNALETASAYIPLGSKVFTVISRYDDVLATIVKRPNYRAGDTVKLVLPFLKAYGATNGAMQEFASKHLTFVPHAKRMMQHIMSLTEAFIVSTSYQTYVKALCDHLDFPFENTCSTRIDLDSYPIEQGEKEELQKIATEIGKMQVFNLPTNAQSLSDFSPQEQDTIQRLDQIFWKQIARMKIGKIYTETTAVGGKQKSDAIKHIADELDVKLSDVMYVGDSITDVEAFKMINENNGLTVSFNGNQYAVENAEIAIISDTCLATTVIADAFIRAGKENAGTLAQNWSRTSIKDSTGTSSLAQELLRSHPSRLPKAEIVTPENIASLTKESSDFRSRFRGEAVGTLG